jgi:integral membrane protein
VKHWVTFVGYLEGFSFLILMFYAMPMKYFAGEPEMVSLFGSIHGGLFVAYVACCCSAWASIGRARR